MYADGTYAHNHLRSKSRQKEAITLNVDVTVTGNKVNVGGNAYGDGDASPTVSWR